MPTTQSSSCIVLLPTAHFNPHFRLWTAMHLPLLLHPLSGPLPRPRPVSISISQHGFILGPSLANNTACAILNRKDASVIRPQHTSDGVCECRSTRPFTVLQVTHSIRDAHGAWCFSFGQVENRVWLSQSSQVATHQWSHVASHFVCQFRTFMRATSHQDFISIIHHPHRHPDMFT